MDGLLETGEGADEGGFADAVTAHEADHFPGMEGEVELVEEGLGGIADGERLGLE